MSAFDEKDLLCLSKGESLLLTIISPCLLPLQPLWVWSDHPFCFKTLGGHLSPSPNDVLQKTSFLYLQKCDGNMNINNSHGFPANIHHHGFEALS